MPTKLIPQMLKSSAHLQLSAPKIDTLESMRTSKSGNRTVKIELNGDLSCIALSI